MKVLWRIAWPCFTAAGLLAIANVLMLNAWGVTAWTPWLYVAALWLLVPAGWLGIQLITNELGRILAPKDTP